MLIEVTRDPVTPDPVVRSLDRRIHGAVVTFMGTTRRFTGEREVQHLDYEAYPEMAEEKLRQVAEETKAKFALEDISIVHRIGRIRVGETSLVVAVASLHRREGFEACLHAVERIKEMVPIWKKEVFAEGGATWVRSEGA